MGNTRSQPPAPGLPPSPGLPLPSCTPVRNDTDGESRSKRQTFKADSECLWLIDENKTHRSSVSQDDRWNFAFKGQVVKNTALLLVGRRV